MEGPPTEAALALHMMLCMFGQLATAGRSQDKPAWHWIACSFRPSFGFFGSLPADLSQSMDGAATRASAWVTRARPCVRCVLCSPAFLLVPALGSTGSGCPALFVGFTATMAESDFPRSCIIGFGSSPYRRTRAAVCRSAVGGKPDLVRLAAFPFGSSCILSSTISATRTSRRDLEACSTAFAAAFSQHSVL